VLAYTLNRLTSHVAHRVAKAGARWITSANLNRLSKSYRHWKPKLLVPTKPCNILKSISPAPLPVITFVFFNVLYFSLFLKIIFISIIILCLPLWRTCSLTQELKIAESSYNILYISCALRSFFLVIYGTGHVIFMHQQAGSILNQPHKAQARKAP